MKGFSTGKRTFAKGFHCVMILTLAAGLFLGAVPGSQPAQAAVQANLVINGSFEEPVVPAAGFYYLPSIPGWSLSQGSFFELQRDIWPTAEGAQVLELDSNGSTSIYQDLPTTPGEAYLLAFAFSARPEQPEAENVFEVRWNSSPLSDPLTADGTGLLTTDWTTYSFTVVASASTSRLEFAYLGPPDRYGSLIDNVSLTPLGVIGNDSWTNARALPLAPDVPASADQLLFKPGQSAWYKFPVLPGSRLVVELTGLPANYDLTVYKDIAAAFQTLSSPQDLVRLGAEFAPDAFSPDAFSPDAFSPDAFSPDAFSPDAFSPDAFSPDAFSPDAFSPDAFSPDAFSPDAFSPDAFSPDAFSPDAFSPDAFSPDAFSSDAYSSAQTRSLIGVSAFDGTASEGIAANTWDNSGDFYVRVRGRNGAFSLAAPFHLQVTLLNGACGTVSTALPPSSTAASAGSYKTVVLTDLERMEGTPEEKNALQEQLASFASLPEVSGVVVDVGADARVAAANAQADTNLDCPYAKNLVAEAVSSIIAAYRSLNPLEYVVIAGSDDVIPFFRHPDGALLASEKNYAPPVRDATASQASLKLGYVLSQDRYGAQTEISLKTGSLPIPDLAVGRLVETSAEVSGLLDVYLNTPGGVAPAPASTLVTGYDFLEDAALAVKAELEAGTGLPADTLIAPRDLSPQDPSAWTASQLSELLLGSRHDLIFLTGHFSAGSALAADYRTRLTASELASSNVDLTNTVVFSAGCHAGYSIVNGHGVPNVTQEPDWAQAFARKGAALIAGTGYQYGDTDFIEYSERLYLEFTRQLRAGSGPVPIGKALVAAKQAYLAGTPQWRGIHEKALLQATLFGLPMLSVNLPQGRGSLPGDSSIVSTTTPAAANPGLTLGLSFADIELTPALMETNVTLTNPADQSTVNATYLSGANGVLANPAEPILPLERRNVTVAGQVLRGAGLRSGVYTDLVGILPLTGAATTEVRGVHTPFITSIFYPPKPWNVNYFEALSQGQDGSTRLMVFPAQFQSSAAPSTTGTLRKYSSLGFRLYYSANMTTYPTGNIPALSAAPSIGKVSSTISSGEVNFDVSVTGDPAAGIQEVWVTYTALSGPLAGAWQSLDLAQNAADSTRWQGLLPLAGALPQDIRYIVQAVNGVGLVTLSTNLGAYYIPGVDPVAQANQGQPTELALLSPPASGVYGTQVSVSALLTSAGTPLAGERVTFGIGSQRRQAVTGSDGTAAVELPILGLPGIEQMQAAFAGDETYTSSWTSSAFTIDKQGTNLLLQPVSLQPGGDETLMAVLKDAAGRPLGQKTVFFVVQGNGSSFSTSTITDYAGQGILDAAPLSGGSYTVDAYFAGTIPLPEGALTLDDERYLPSTASGALELNSPPVCTAAAPSTAVVWPANKKFVRIDLSGISDPDGETVTLTITSIFQDERVGKHHSSPDGRGVGGAFAEVRAERDGKGDGRVYHIRFTAYDPRGSSCTGEVLVQVPHDQNKPAVDGGALYDSTVRDDD